MSFRVRPEAAAIVDEHTRPWRWRVGHSCAADEVVVVIEALVAERGAPGKSENGQRLIACAMWDWRRFAGTITTYIEPGSSWENPFIESFDGRVRDDLLIIEELGSLHRSPGRCRRVARRLQHLPAPLIPRWPTPAEYLMKWTITQQRSVAAGPSTAVPSALLMYVTAVALGPRSPRF